MMNSHAVQQLNQKVVSIDSLITATHSIANNAMNEVQKMKNKILALEKEIKTLKGAA